MADLDFILATPARGVLDFRDREPLGHRGQAHLAHGVRTKIECITTGFLVDCKHFRVNHSGRSVGGPTNVQTSLEDFAAMIVSGEIAVAALKEDADIIHRLRETQLNRYS